MKGKLMFVYKDRAVSLRNLRDVRRVHVDSKNECFMLEYKEERHIFVTKEMGAALLAKLSEPDDAK